MNELRQIFQKINKLPPENQYKLHPGIVKIYQQRQESFDNDQGLDFATAEALAFGSLLVEGYGVRVSGEDAERGTFSHRHAKLSDQFTEKEKYVPLNNLLTPE